MDTLAIVAEYNPFHNGHLYQLEQTRAALGARGCIMVIMSGDWVQRGGPSILDKWIRADLCLGAGADIVLELPTIFATQSAQYFADGAVRVAHASGIIRHQWAGAEDPESSLDKTIANILATEPEAYREGLRTALDEGQGFAAARTAGLRAALPEIDADVLTAFMEAPNNNLNLGYLVAHQRFAPQMRLVRHRRVPGSATVVRDAVAKVATPSDTIRAVKGQVPSMTAGALAYALQSGTLVTDQTCFPLLASAVRGHATDTLGNFEGMQDGVAERAQAAILVNGPSSASLDGWVSEISTKRYPRSRVRRAIANVSLGITADLLARHQAAGPQYLRVLGFSKQGRYALKLMRRHAKLPIITKASDFLEFNRQTHPQLREQAELDLKASDLRSLMVGGGCGSDFAKAVIMR